MGRFDGVRIVDPDPVIEEMLSKMQRRVAQPILGPRGEVLLNPIIDDRSMTMAKDGESYTANPEQLFMAGYRMLRDGMGLKQIRDELDLIQTGPQAVPLHLLESALVNFGKPLLEAAIAAGTEPAETKRVIGYESPRVEGDDDLTVTTEEVPFMELAPEARRAHRANIKRGLAKRGRRA